MVTEIDIELPCYCNFVINSVKTEMLYFMNCWQLDIQVNKTQPRLPGWVSLIAHIDMYRCYCYIQMKSFLSCHSCHRESVMSTILCQGTTKLAILYHMG